MASCPITQVDFNKFTPLPCGNLRGKILTLAWSLNFPVNKLLVFPALGSSSDDSYAYTYGFFKKKWIVLCDTLLKQSKDDEIVALIAHELGHLKLNHTTYSFIAAQMRASSVSDDSDFAAVWRVHSCHEL